MSDIRVIYQDAEGVKIMQPTDEALKKKGLGAIIKRSVPEGIPYVITDVHAIPSNRDFRGAWKLHDDSIVLDSKKTKDIQLDRLRNARDLALKDLDIEQMKLISINASIDSLAEKKQTLRDITDPLKSYDTDAAFVDINEIKRLGDLKQIDAIMEG